VWPAAGAWVPDGRYHELQDGGERDDGADHGAGRDDLDQPVLNGMPRCVPSMPRSGAAGSTTATGDEALADRSLGRRAGQSLATSPRP
jgi:hypothetical protein